MRVYCDKTTEAIESRKVAKCLTLQRGKFDDEVRRDSSRLQAQTRVK